MQIVANGTIPRFGSSPFARISFTVLLLYFLLLLPHQSYSSALSLNNNVGNKGKLSLPSFASLRGITKATTTARRNRAFFSCGSSFTRDSLASSCCIRAKNHRGEQGILLALKSFSSASSEMISSEAVAGNAATRESSFGTDQNSKSAHNSRSDAAFPPPLAKYDAVIVGGGLAGLAAAAALRNVANLPNVVVIERRSSQSFQDDAAGAAAQLGPNGLRALRCIGGEELLRKVLEAGTALEGHAILSSGASEEKSAAARLQRGKCERIAFAAENGEKKEQSDTSHGTDTSPPPSSSEERKKKRKLINADAVSFVSTMVIPDEAGADTGLPQVLIRWGVLRQILADLLPPGSVRTGVEDDVVGYRYYYHRNEGNGSCSSNAGGSDVSATVVEPLIRKKGEGSSDDGDGDLIPLSLPPLENVGSGSAAAANSNDAVATTRILVAAEGVRSTFRSLLHSPNPPQLASKRDSNSSWMVTTDALPLGSEDAARKSDVRDNGRVNIKAVVRKNLSDEEFGFRPNHTYSYFVPGGAGVACFAGPAGEGYTYWAVSIADGVDEEVVENSHGNGTKEEDGNNDSGTSKKMKRPFLTKEESSDLIKVKSSLLEKLTTGLGSPHADECVRFAVDLIRATDPRRIYVSRSEESSTIGPHLVPTTTAPMGDRNAASPPPPQVVLVGDAAHPMSTSYGQAANFAFEDAAVLASCLRDASSVAGECGDDTSTLSSSRCLVGAALERYSEARVDRCLEMQRRSKERAERALRGETVEDVSKWIFKWDVVQ